LVNLLEFRGFEVFIGVVQKAFWDLIWS